MKYEQLMKRKPTKYGSMVNSLGQEIDFYECPIYGDETSVIAACESLQLADYTGFYELDDMTAEDGEYEPNFRNGVFYIGDLQK
jgi:hypothetical protein